MSDDGADPPFDDTILDRLREIEEVEIETRRASGEQRLTIIWIVADDRDPYVRSVRGTEGWWYRDLSARPDGALHVEGRRVPFRPVTADDSETVEAVSEMFRAKYGRRQPASTEAMVMPHTLPTTLRLVPA